MANIVKLVLVLATGTAYFQCVWHHARCRPTKISQFDTIVRSLGQYIRTSTLWILAPTANFDG